jgi:hypothetical protein
MAHPDIDAPAFEGRLMACDVRPQKLGYAVFEFRDEMQLVDWGRRRFYKARVRRLILGDLLRLLHPSVLVLRKLSDGSRRNTSRITKVTGKIKREARAARTRIAWLGESSLARFFRKSGKLTRQQIAESMAELFPEIAWKLPAPRKPWLSEDWGMPLFDAIALGFAYFALKMGPPTNRA